MSHSETWHSGDSADQYSNLAERVKPNMKAVYKRTNFMLVVSTIILLTGFFTVIIFVGIPIFILGVALVSTFSVKKQRIRHIITLMNEIKSVDKSRLENFSLSRYTGRVQVMMIIKKLIETNNLPEYELIGEVGVAKISVQARESDFTSGDSTVHAKQPATAVNHECPGCGATITEGNNGKFCKYCGTRLP